MFLRKVTVNMKMPQTKCYPHISIIPISPFLTQNKTKGDEGDRGDREMILRKVTVNMKMPQTKCYPHISIIPISPFLTQNGLPHKKWTVKLGCLFIL